MQVYILYLLVEIEKILSDSQLFCYIFSRDGASLSQRQVLQIFELRHVCHGARMGAAIGRVFGVTPKAVRDIWAMKTWTSLTSLALMDAQNLSATERAAVGNLTSSQTGIGADSCSSNGCVERQDSRAKRPRIDGAEQLFAVDCCRHPASDASPPLFALAAASDPAAAAAPRSAFSRWSPARAAAVRAARADQTAARAGASTLHVPQVSESAAAHHPGFFRVAPSCPWRPQRGPASAWPPLPHDPLPLDPALLYPPASCAAAVCAATLPPWMRYAPPTQNAVAAAAAAANYAAAEAAEAAEAEAEAEAAAALTELWSGASRRRRQCEAVAEAGAGQARSPRHEEGGETGGGVRRREEGAEGRRARHEEAGAGPVVKEEEEERGEAAAAAAGGVDSE
jgi:hypothetical protein